MFMVHVDIEEGKWIARRQTNSWISCTCNLPYNDSDVPI